MFRLSRPHALVAAILFVVEVGIALFVHDAIVRPHFGDLLVVMLVHFTLRAFVDIRPRPAAIATFAFACLVEGAQAVHLVQRLGLQHNEGARVVLGDTFSWLDIGAYAVGTVLAVLLDRRMIAQRTGR